MICVSDFKSYCVILTQGRSFVQLLGTCFGCQRELMIPRVIKMLQ